jgi:hypothetical protein
MIHTGGNDAKIKDKIIKLITLRGENVGRIHST